MKRVFCWLGLTLLLLWAMQSAATATAPAYDPGGGDATPAVGSWRSGGPYDIQGAPAHVSAVAASPFYAQDGTLFAAGTARSPYGSIFRSTDRGQTWTEVFYPEPPGPYSGGWFGQVVAAPAGATTMTLFASYNGNLSPSDLAGQAPAAPYATLYRSTDQGVSWSSLWARMQIGTLAASPAFASDHTLFAMSQGTLHRSTDAGGTWQPLSFPSASQEVDVFYMAISPGYPSDHTLYAGGYGRTYRSSDSAQTWQPLGGYNPTFGMALSPNFSSDGVLWAAYRTIEAVGDGTPESGVIRYSNRGANWRLATVGLPGVFDPNPRRLAVSPAYTSDGSLFTALSGPMAGWMQHGLFRTHNGGESWIDLGSAPGNPNVFDLIATRTAAEGLTAHLATETGVWHYGGLCEERLVNGGFELDAGWVFPDTPADAGYSLRQAHSGQRSVRAGIDGSADVYSYSSALQSLTLPTGLSSARLDVWWYPVSQESALVAEPDPLVLAQVAAFSAPAEVAANDAQYVLLLDGQGNIIKTLHWARSNARAWQRLSFDLAPYIGTNFRLLFGAFNNGDGRRTAMYVDDVSLATCWPQPASQRVHLPAIWRARR